jgi:hypothetical protein
MIATVSAWMTDSVEGVDSFDGVDPFEGDHSDPFVVEEADPFIGGLFDSGPLAFFAPIIILAVIGFATIIYLSYRAGKQDQARIAALRAWTAQRDYSFMDEEPDLGRIYARLPSESGGERLRFEHVVRGRLAGLPFTAFDYSYETTSTSSSSSGSGTTSSTTTHRIQVVAIDGPAGWPAVRVSPQHLGSRLAVLFGRQDVQIGQDEFDRAFRVRADDEDAARRLIAPMASALLARTDQEFWVDGSTVLALRRGTLEAADLETWLGQLKAVLSQAPIQDR